VSAGDWAGRELGERTVSYTARDAILYALAVGASPEDLDLVWEERLRVLPSFGLTLAQWAPDILAEERAFDNRSVHGSQLLEVRAPLPTSGNIRMSAHVGNVWDKGSAAIFEVVVDSDYFIATWSIFAPGSGGFGGERGPSSGAASDFVPAGSFTAKTAANQAALYRLSGDRHDIHIDPAASTRIGQPRPILQGLCTLALVTLPLARSLRAHPADLKKLGGRFTGVVIPGDELAVRYDAGGWFEVHDGDELVISSGTVVFG
jgi:MaoC like domain